MWATARNRWSISDLSDPIDLGDPIDPHDLRDPALAPGRNRQALAALGATALQDGLAVLGPHPDEESMCPAAPAVVRLKRALSLTHRRILGPRAHADADVRPCRRTSNGSQATLALSIPARLPGVLRSAIRVRRKGPRLGVPPKVFHTCGKNCGKRGVCKDVPPADRQHHWYLAMAKGLTGRFSSGRR